MKFDVRFSLILHASPNFNISRSMDYFEFFSAYFCLWSSFSSIQDQIKTSRTEFELICIYDFSLPTLSRFLSLPENVPVGSWQLSLPL